MIPSVLKHSMCFNIYHFMSTLIPDVINTMYYVTIHANIFGNLIEFSNYDLV